LNTVGTVLAEVITDLVKAIEGLAVDLEKLPLVVSLDHNVCFIKLIVPRVLLSSTSMVVWTLSSPVLKSF
jgi:hypothetical protein